MFTLRQNFAWVRWLKEHDKEMKLYPEEVRQLRVRLTHGDNDDRVFIKNDWDRAVYRFPLGQFETREEAEKYADTWYRYEATPSQYDCTGQIATAWQSVHYWKGQYWCWQADYADV